MKNYSKLSKMSSDSLSSNEETSKFSYSQISNISQGRYLVKSKKPKANSDEQTGYSKKRKASARSEKQSNRSVSSRVREKEKMKTANNRMKS